MKNLLHQLSDDFGGRRQDGGFVLRFAGFQDGVEIHPAVGQVLAHAEEEAVEMVTQLDWLRRNEIRKIIIIADVWEHDGTEANAAVSYQGSHLILR